jgi:hypothetical protein
MLWVFVNRNVEEDSVARMRAVEEALAAKKKEEPSFELSGKLAEETNRYRGETSDPSISFKNITCYHYLVLETFAIVFSLHV